MFCCDGCVQLEKLQSECNDKENSISELSQQLRDNSAKLDCIQQEYGVYIAVAPCVMTMLHCIQLALRFLFNTIY